MKYKLGCPGLNYGAHGTMILNLLIVQDKSKTNPKTVKYEIVFDFFDTKAELRTATGIIIPCSTTDNHSGYHFLNFQKMLVHL